MVQYYSERRNKLNTHSIIFIIVTAVVLIPGTMVSQNSVFSEIDSLLFEEKIAEAKGKFEIIPQTGDSLRVEYQRLFAMIIKSEAMESTGLRQYCEYYKKVSDQFTQERVGNLSEKMYRKSLQYIIAGEYERAYQSLLIVNFFRQRWYTGEIKRLSDNLELAYQCLDRDDISSVDSLLSIFKSENTQNSPFRSVAGVYTIRYGTIETRAIERRHIQFEEEYVPAKEKTISGCFGVSAIVIHSAESPEVNIVNKYVARDQTFYILGETKPLLQAGSGYHIHLEYILSSSFSAIIAVDRASRKYEQTHILPDNFIEYGNHSSRSTILFKNNFTITSDRILAGVQYGMNLSQSIKSFLSVSSGMSIYDVQASSTSGIDFTLLVTPSKSKNAAVRGTLGVQLDYHFLLLQIFNSFGVDISNRSSSGIYSIELGVNMGMTI